MFILRIILGQFISSGRGAVRLARLLWEQEVGGSNPLAPTEYIRRYGVADFPTGDDANPFTPTKAADAQSKYFVALWLFSCVLKLHYKEIL